MQINENRRYTVTIKECGSTSETTLELVPKVETSNALSTFQTIVECCREAIKKLDL